MTQRAAGAQIPFRCHRCPEFQPQHCGGRSGRPPQFGLCWKPGLLPAVWLGQLGASPAQGSRGPVGACPLAGPRRVPQRGATGRQREQEKLCLPVLGLRGVVLPGPASRVLTWSSLCGLCPDVPFHEGPGETGLGLLHQDDLVPAHWSAAVSSPDKGRPEVVQVGTPAYILGGMGTPFDP